MTPDKSILFGVADPINKVYPNSVKLALQSEAGLQSEIITKQDLEEARPNLVDTHFIFSTWGMPALGEDAIRLYFPKLEAVFYAAGSVQGFARPFLSSGVRVFSAWKANAVPVAEYTLAQILLANKNFYACARYETAGDHDSAQAVKAQILGNYRCKVGIIGAGMIGKMVAQLLKQHDLEVLVFDPFLPDDKAMELGVKKVPLERIFEECQTISNHLANNPQTFGIFDYALFNRMLPGSVFINTGRGAQVVEPDLARLLKERPDVTAVLDVTFPEPPEPGHPFYSLPNVILTPHIAGSIGNEFERMSLYMLEEYRRFTRGEPCFYEVTEEMLKTMA